MLQYPKNVSRETVIVGLLAVVVIGTAIDLYTDLVHGATLQHVAKEALVVLLSMAAMAWLLAGMRKQAREMERLKQDFQRMKDGQHGQSEQASDYVLAGRRQLREAVSRQLNDWKLTQSEKEVAWMLLKGLSLKEIAAVRETTEKTVRQQASAIYKKAGVSGRHVFSAWFMEDAL